MANQANTELPTVSPELILTTVPLVRYGVIGRTHPNYLNRLVGIHGGSAVFDAAMQMVDEERERQRDAAELLSEEKENNLEAECFTPSIPIM